MVSATRCCSPGPVGSRDVAQPYDQRFYQLKGVREKGLTFPAAPADELTVLRRVLSI